MKCISVRVPDQLQRHVHLELAETVVSQRWCGEANKGRCENGRPHDFV